MKRWFKKKTWTLLLFSVLAVFIVILLAETLVVKVKTTNLRKEPVFYAETIAVLKAGEAVEKVAEQAGWYKVKTAKGIQGWVHSSAVSSKSFDLLSLGRTTKTGASAEEVALASKGFNRQVEDAYKAKHKDANFAGVDRMLRLKVTPAQLRRFLEQGKLGKFGEPK
ncbi:MAG: SH3 domain-containing protein [Candidatus Aminicenantes bacterium]|nr:SH3 domain-containing protein [Candidatus Aminicenantes bacterium]